MNKSKISVSEIFISCQGEARFTGVPSVFLRTFGCNFRCKNFGRYQEHVLEPSVTHNPEVITIINDLDQYKSFDQLPLVSTGCDSYSSVYPEFRHLAQRLTVDQIVERCRELLPFHRWRKEHLVITGGEPLLGWQKYYPDLLEHEFMRDLRDITFETNGTQPLTETFFQYLKTWNQRRYTLGAGGEITFSVSAKLPNSGESWADAIKPDVVCQYQSIGHTYLKFVVATDDDIQAALQAMKEYQDSGFDGDVYLMPVGGVESVYHLNARRVAEASLQHGLRYSARLQCDLFGNAWGT